ncbi:hypothetical protein Dimus_004949, partial [Dionaea muscipula]
MQAVELCLEVGEEARGGGGRGFMDGRPTSYAIVGEDMDRRPTPYAIDGEDMDRRPTPHAIDEKMNVSAAAHDPSNIDHMYVSNFSCWARNVALIFKSKYES